MPPDRAHAAAVCERGHLVRPDVADEEPPRFCPDCGASAIEACPTCGHPIPPVPTDGDAFGAWYDEARWRRPSFCENCGSAFPWIGRQERIYELQNLLDREPLDPADALRVREQLDALAQPDLPEDEQRERWTTVKRIAPGLTRAGARIIEGLASATIRQQVGL